MEAQFHGDNLFGHVCIHCYNIFQQCSFMMNDDNLALHSLCYITAYFSFITAHLCSDNLFFRLCRWQRLEGAYRQAMSALREARSGSIAVEQHRNFAGKRCNSSPAFGQAKRPKMNSWTRKFFCLAETEESKVPSNT